MRKRCFHSVKHLFYYPLFLLAMYLYPSLACTRVIRLAMVVMLAIVSQISCTSVPETEVVTPKQTERKPIRQTTKPPLTLLDRVEQKYGKEARIRVSRWQQLIEQNQLNSELDKLKLTNDFFNQLVFVDDIIHWQRNDYWATPIETLATNGGDCEDFAIAKYYTLSQLGVAEECLKLVYVKALSIDRAHMVVSYQCFKNDVPLILDNLNAEILPGHQRSDLLPVYSFNAKGLWATKSMGLDKKVNGKRDFRLWNDLQKRMYNNEF